jgi:hypothetical protein
MQITEHDPKEDGLQRKRDAAGHVVFHVTPLRAERAVGQHNKLLHDVGTEQRRVRHLVTHLLRREAHNQASPP